MRAFSLAIVWPNPGNHRNQKAFLKCFTRIQQDGYWAVVHQFDFHGGLEAAGFAGQSQGADLIDEEFVELAGMAGRGGGVEGRTFAAADVAVERELRDCQNAGAGFERAAVHFPLVIFEDAEAGDFFGEVNRVGFGVVAGNAEEDEESQADLASDLVADRNLGAAYALHDRSHEV